MSTSESLVEEKPAESKLAKPSWIKMKSEEMEELIVNLSNEGKTPGQIGIILRDKHGIPRMKALGKRITQVLGRKGVKYKSEKDVVDEKIEKLKRHLVKNKHDHTATRALTSKLWDLRMYKTT